MNTLRLGTIVLALLAGAPAAQAGVTVIPARDSFPAGTEIVFTVTNGSSELIMFGSSAPYFLKNLDTGAVVDFVGLTIMIDLPAGESLDFTIPDGELEAGRYGLHVAYYDKTYQTHMLSAEFTLEPGDQRTPTGPDTMGRAKARYQRR